jgi:DNA repair photolyase
MTSLALPLCSNESTTRPRVIQVPRRGAVLHASPLAGEGDVLSLNLARGCAHRCAFCSVRAYPTFPGDEVVMLFEDTAGALDRELSHRRRLPRAVFVSPSTDPFPPFEEVQDEAARVVGVLARHGVEAWLMTRGEISPAALDALASHRERVKVTVALTTLDERLHQTLEPAAAAPRRRVAQLAELRRRGVRVQAAVEPLIPGLTDTRDNLLPLLEALSRAGVRHVTASYVFLRPGIEENLARALEVAGLDGSVLDAYSGGPMLEAPGLAAARYLPRWRRQRGYAALMTLAAGFGITAGVCGTTNPDFSSAHRPATAPSRPTLLARFLQTTAAL